MPYMYILECSDSSFYTGSTKDLPRRLWQHQNGLGANHTKKRLPVKLVYAEYYDRVEDAFYREKQVQGWSRKKKIALMNSDWNRLHVLAECQNESHYRRGLFEHRRGLVEHRRGLVEHRRGLVEHRRGLVERSRNQPLQGSRNQPKPSNDED